MLIVLGGLPGTGKTTLARLLSEAVQAAYLRIDAIEQSLRDLKQFQGGVDDAGYRIAYALAESNLQLGQTVIADSVNPIAITRNAWGDIAARTESRIVEIETICSDAEEHRRRIETRVVDIPGLVPPTWQQVVEREYEPWDRPHIVVDTAKLSPEDALKEILTQIWA
jgi:predicted kinase